MVAKASNSDAQDTADVRGVTAPDGSVKARLERGALNLFREHGVDGVSTRAIAEAAGVSEGAIYKHFKSKEVLAQHLFEAIHEKLYALVEEQLNAAESFDDGVLRVVKTYCKAADDDPTLFEYHLTHMFRFGVRHYPGRPDPTTLIASRIQDAIDNGACPPGNPEIKAAAALGVVLQPAAHRMAGRFEGTMTDHADQFARASLAAVKET